MDTETLRAHLALFPRVCLGEWPTPLEEMPRLSTALAGARLWVKRDDYTGPGLGGSKTRKLEFLLAQAQARGARRVVTCGALQSNHLRLTAAACAQLGLDAHLLFLEPRPRCIQGNLLIDALCGARMHFLPVSGWVNSRWLSIESTTRLARLIVLAHPAIPKSRLYFLPPGGLSPMGARGSVVWGLELRRRGEERGLALDWVGLARGGGAMLAGLMACFALLACKVRLLGVDVGKLWRNFSDSIAALATAATYLLGEPHVFRPQAVPLVGGYADDGYGTVWPESVEAVRRTAESEGLLLEPIYTGKAMVGLLDMVNHGWFRPGENVVFLHSGGGPGLFALSGR